jgi:ABC-2 type transport system permease protein
MAVRAHLKAYRKYLSLHIKTAMEYRTNFIAQSCFMLLNDSLWLVMWYFLFKELGTVNGYTTIDAILIFGITALSFGIVFVFFGNTNRVWEQISEGGFDFYLSTPLNEQFHAIISRMNFSAVGDIIFGLLVLAYIVPAHFLLGVLVSILGAVVLLSFEMIIDALAFFLERPKKVSYTLHRLVVGLSSWPIDIYPNTARAILYLFLFAFISTVPRNILASVSLTQLFYLTIVAVLLLSISILVWRIGIRRYESGNMLTTRV